MMFLLDTNVISELRKKRPHAAVLQWYATYPERFYALPAISVFEIQVGAEVTRKQDHAKAEEIEAWLSGLMEDTTLLSLDARAAREAAKLLRNRPSTLMTDAMIAAIAKVNGLTVATRNIRDFTLFDVPVVNPFAFRPA